MTDLKYDDSDVLGLKAVFGDKGVLGKNSLAGPVLGVLALSGIGIGYALATNAVIDVADKTLNDSVYTIQKMDSGPSLFMSASISPAECVQKIKEEKNIDFTEGQCRTAFQHAMGVHSWAVDFRLEKYPAIHAWAKEQIDATRSFLRSQHMQPAVVQVDLNDIGNSAPVYERQGVFMRYDGKTYKASTPSP